MVLGLTGRASSKLANLSIHSTAGACITHRQGNLTVEVSPVSQFAGRAAAPSARTLRWHTQEAMLRSFTFCGAQACSLCCAGTGLNHLCAPIVTLATERSLFRGGAPAASAGVLNVVETRIKVMSF